MKRFVCLLIWIVPVCSCFAQFSSGRIEAYASPGLFSTQFSHDSLVPQRMQGRSRIGDLVSYGIQYGVPVGSRTSLKAGIGYSTRQYSMVKYGPELLFLLIIPFSSFPLHDSFPIARMQYNNGYVEVPLSFDYNVSRSKAVVQVQFGFNARLQFLAKAKATITPDDQSSALASPAAIREAETRYADDVTSFVCTLEPYMDISFRLYKGIGIYYRVKPFAFYASPLNHKVASSEAEFVSGGIGLWYRF